MNLYTLLGGILLAAALFGAGYITGKHIAEGEAAQAAEIQRGEYQKQLDDRDGRVDKAAREAAAIALQLENLKRAKTKEVIRYVQTPAANVACLDSVGIGVWNNDAETGTGALRPDDVRPGAGDAHHP